MVPLFSLLKSLQVYETCLLPLIKAQNISSLPEFKTKFISEPLLKGVSQEVKIFCIISHGLPETDITKVTAKLEKDVKKLWLNQKSIIQAIAIIGVLSITLAIFLWKSL